MQNLYVKLFFFAVVYVTLPYAHCKLCFTSWEIQNGDLMIDSISGSEALDIDYTAKRSLAHLKMVAEVTTESGQVKEFTFETDDAQADIVQKMCESGSPDTSSDDSFAIKEGTYSAYAARADPLESFGQKMDMTCTVYENDAQVLKVDFKLEAC